MAGSIVLFQKEISGQVHYTDINPDIEINSTSEDFALDINDDGISDFNFKWVEGSFGLGSDSFPFYYEVGIKIYPEPGFSNDVIGSSFYAWTFNENWFGYVEALNPGFDINPIIDNEWAEFGGFLCARKYAFYYSPGWFKYEIGFWQGEVHNKYLGIRFQDVDSNTYFGWIRCDAPDSSRVLIIKDFAWEFQPNTGIIAGDTLGITSIQSSFENGIIFSLYPNPAINKLTIRQYSRELIYCQILDITGNEIMQIQLQNQSEEINLQNISSGTYYAILKNHEGIVIGRRQFIKISN